MKKMKLVVATCLIAFSSIGNAGKIAPGKYKAAMDRCEAMTPNYIVTGVYSAGAAASFVGAYVTGLFGKAGITTGSGAGGGGIKSSAQSAVVSAIAGAIASTAAGVRLWHAMEIKETKEVISELYLADEEGRLDQAGGLDQLNSLIISNLRTKCIEQLGSQCNFTQVVENLVVQMNQDQLCNSKSAVTINLAPRGN